jgi:hypothetical protein
MLNTILHTACIYGDIDVIKKYIDDTTTDSIISIITKTLREIDTWHAMEEYSTEHMRQLVIERENKLHYCMEYILEKMEE